MPLLPPFPSRARTPLLEKLPGLLVPLLAALCLLLLSACAQQEVNAGPPNGEDPEAQDVVDDLDRLGEEDLEREGVPPESDAAESAQWLAGLGILPENGRYFEYNGLPMVMFNYQGGLAPTPTATFSPDVIEAAANHGNSMFTALHPDWVRASYSDLLDTLQDDRHWERLEELARTAHENDVVLHLYFWSYLFNFGEGDFTGSDMVWDDPDFDGGRVVGDWTRRDLHELAIERAVEATWQYPNVVYNFMWEYNTRRNDGKKGFRDQNGDFYRWWVEKLRAAGERIDPDVEHLVSIVDGRPLPGDGEADFSSRHSPDFIVDEDGNGFWYSCETGHEKLLQYEVPLVFISSDYPFGDNVFGSWGEVSNCPRKRSRGNGVSDYRITPEDVRNMVQGGFHPAEAWAQAPENTLAYYLQARWYMENRGVLDRSMDGALQEVPAYRPSQRPALSNADGYDNGRKGSSYAAVYSHPDGHAPAQAEVWVDTNGDGRFSPDPADGERFAMTAGGGDYEEGVLFTAEAPADRPYVFRFADRNWNPPVAGGLVPGSTSGISYDHWR